MVRFSCLIHVDVFTSRRLILSSFFFPEHAFDLSSLPHAVGVAAELSAQRKLETQGS